MYNTEKDLVSSPHSWVSMDQLFSDSVPTSGDSLSSLAFALYVGMYELFVALLTGARVHLPTLKS